MRKSPQLVHLPRDCPAASKGRPKRASRRLADADLRDADLEGAILLDANLTGADLRGAKLDKADLRGAVGVR